jgi:hypothetical protein
MNTALRHELEQLLQETSALLACPDFEPPTWEAYEARRAAIFMRIQGMTPPTDGEEHAAVSGLIRDILTQDAALMKKARIRLTSLGAELATVANSRRALHGYTSLPPAILFQSEA